VRQEPRERWWQAEELRNCGILEENRSSLNVRALMDAGMHGIHAGCLKDGINQSRAGLLCLRSKPARCTPRQHGKLLLTLQGGAQEACPSAWCWCALRSRRGPRDNLGICPLIISHLGMPSHQRSEKQKERTRESEALS